MALLAAGLALGACAMPDIDSFRTPDAATLFRPLSVTSFKEKQRAAVSAEDLVDAAGRCAGVFVAAGPSGDPALGQSVGQTGGEAPTQIVPQPPGQTVVSLQEGGVPTIPAAIALDMTECDVVKRAGLADRVEIGTDAGGARTATLTYLRGTRPGIYHFAAGRLKSMERAPEPPPPPKPAQRSPRSKRAATR